jgi:hypothetical protein
MTRSFLSAALIGLAAMALVPAYLQGCSQTGVGDPCTPEQEYGATFTGFSEQEVNVESKSFDCLTRLCLANHFRGRVTCPYGQTSTGGAPGDGTLYKDTNGNYIGACVLPGGGLDLPDGGAPSVDGVSQAVVGTLGSGGANASAEVQGQCTDRTAADTVYCSCRCANEQGKTDDGADYCSCPDGFVCQQLVTSIGSTDEGLTGAYCIKNNTQFNALGVCAQQCVASAGPTAGAVGNCGTFNGQ